MHVTQIVWTQDQPEHRGHNNPAISKGSRVWAIAHKGSKPLRYFRCAYVNQDQADQPPENNSRWPA